MPDQINAPKDDLIRAVFQPGLEMRADSEGGPKTLHGHFATFNSPTEINSWEGCFIERLAPGAFSKTIRENRDNIKVLYDHGYDPQLGNKPLGPIAVLEEDGMGCRYEVPLIDTDYNRNFIIPAAEAGLLGASFRFRVIRDEWNEDPGRSAENPDGLPERTIKEVKLYEFGPVTFPAYAAATAGVRSKVGLDLWRSLDEDGRKELASLLLRARDDFDGVARSTGTAGREDHNHSITVNVTGDVPSAEDVARAVSEALAERGVENDVNADTTLGEVADLEAQADALAAETDTARSDASDDTVEDVEPEAEIRTSDDEVADPPASDDTDVVGEEDERSDDVSDAAADATEDAPAEEGHSSRTKTTQADRRMAILKIRGVTPWRLAPPRSPTSARPPATPRLASLVTATSTRT